jgi:hypothetical protein
MCVFARVQSLIDRAILSYCERLATAIDFKAPFINRGRVHFFYRAFFLFVRMYTYVRARVCFYFFATRLQTSSNLNVRMRVSPRYFGTTQQQPSQVAKSSGQV